MSAWAVVLVGEDEDQAHVTPIDDLVEHELTDECPCGPADELVQRVDGDRWIVVHQALDGRP